MVRETHFGITLEDPYRWMEAPDDAELRAWLLAQGAYTERQLEKLDVRAALADRLTELSAASTSYGRAVRRGERLFYLEQTPERQLPALMVRDGDGPARVLVDPTEERARHQSIDNFTVSHDGSLVTYNLTADGGEVGSIRVIDAASGTHRPDVIERIWGEFPAVWTPDGAGFFYTQMSEAAVSDPEADMLQGMQLRYHRLGAPPASDAVFLGPGVNDAMPIEPREFPSAYVGPGWRWAVAFASGARREMRVAIAPLDALRGAETPWQEVAGYDDLVEDMWIRGEHMYLLTTRDAPNGKLVRVPLATPHLARAEVVVAERPDEVLTGFSGARSGIYLVTQKDGASRVAWLADGASVPRPIALPQELVTAGVLADADRDDALLAIAGWTHPGAYYHYDPSTSTLAPTELRDTTPADYSDIVVERLEARSQDGTLVPLTVLRRRGLPTNGSNPAILNGYGGYGSSRMPRFDPMMLAWLERGGVYAIAHVRGGGEKGRAWYLAGKGANKPNGVADFVACARRLGEAGLSTSGRITAMGGSMGGVLLGRAITDYPDDFGAAIIGAGILNTVRFLHAQNGANQIAELGSPDTEAGFRALLAMDAYHNIERGQHYPATMLIVGLNDNRVPPWASAKFAARMQAEAAPSTVMLVRTDVDGHGIGSTRDQEVAQYADMFAFALDATNAAE